MKPWYIGCIIVNMSWFFYYNGFSTSVPKVRAFLEAEKKENPSLPLGGAGFCWGGYSIFAEARDANSPMDVGFTAHPSGLKLPEDVEGLKKPISVAAPEFDHRVKEPERQLIEDSFKKSEGLKWELKVYKEATHGFSIRAEFGRETSDKQAAEAEEQACSWFLKHFKEVKL
jgi:dienelactone hydrolase